MDRKLVGLADVSLSADAELIGRIEAGELKSFDIEIQRWDAGLPPLAGWADPAGFDPMKHVAWPLIMAAAWIIWRTPDAVREQWPEYREQSTFWNTRIQGQGDELVVREFLEQKPRRSIGDMVASAHAHEGLQHVAASDAIDELLRKLQEDTNDFIATGLPKPNGRREKIPAEEWWDMIPFNVDRYHDDAGPQGESKPRWYEVKVKSADVLRLWPPLPPGAPPIAAEVTAEEIKVKPPSRPTDEQLDEIARGLSKVVLKWEKEQPKGQPALPTQERYPFWAALQIEAEVSMTREEAREVWDRLPGEMKKPGRPSKTLPETLREV